MHVFFAVSGSLAKCGALGELCAWAEKRIAARQAKIIKILKARPGEPTARVVLEITEDGITGTPNGRQIALSRLKKALKNEQKEENSAI